MASQCKVQDIKKKFENMIVENRSALVALCENSNKQTKSQCGNETINGNHSLPSADLNIDLEIGDRVKVSLSRQPSDPVKKLQRSHAFRCERNQKIQKSSPEKNSFLARMNEKKLSKDRLKRLGNVLEDRMRKENFSIPVEVRHNSIPDSEVPKHILDQYAKVLKQKKEIKKDSSLDSEECSSESEFPKLISNEYTKVSKNKNEEQVISSPHESPIDCVMSKQITNQYANVLKAKAEPKQDFSVDSDVASPDFKVPGQNLNDSSVISEPIIQKVEESCDLLIHSDIGLLDPEGPKKTLNHYAKVKLKNDPKKDATVDSGVGSETENLDEEKYGQIRKTNPSFFSNSDDTIRLEKKNPHVVLTDTLKKALKQPLPVGPPPEKPPRTFTSSPAQEKKSTKHMLDRLEQELLRREAEEKQKKQKHKPKELHYMCTEIFDIQQRSLPNPRVESFLKNNTSTLPSHLIGRNNGDHNNKEEHTYDVPYEESNSNENEVKEVECKSNFEKIRRNFENGFQKSEITDGCRKVEITVKMQKAQKSAVETKIIKSLKADPRRDGRLSATEGKRRRIDRNDRMSLKKNSRVDVDKENLCRLMDEIYATVKAGNMDDDRLGNSTDGSTDESVKITRSLTEKRKNYVRGVSSKAFYSDTKTLKGERSKTTTCTYNVDHSSYATHRSWKSFRTSQKDLTDFKMSDSTDSRDFSMDNHSIDEKTGCLNIDLCFEPRERGLFNLCLLVGFNFMTNQAYVKNVFPVQVKPPPHIESLIFPETLSSSSRVEWCPDASATQCYSLVLTDEKGERSYGYCRRVLPEGASACLPLAYCLIGKYRAPGFYYKVLQEIESLHGNSEHEINSILQQLLETDFPEPGEDISITYTDQLMNNTSIKNQLKIADMRRSKTMLELRRRKRGNSPATDPCQGVTETREDLSREVPVKRRVLTAKREANSMLPAYYDLENNNGPKDSSITKILKRPLEPRVDEHNLSTLLDSFGAGLTIKVFGSLLLERKVIIASDKLSQVSSCMEALQSVLYPFVWQQPLISTVPAEIQRDILEAPLPILAGVLKMGDGDHLMGIKFEGMLIDLTTSSKVLFYEGDESTILPTQSYKTLKTSLQMWTTKHKDKRDDKQTRNVMISEAFLRFFVDILGDFRRFFSFGELKEGGFGSGDVVFDKESFIKNASSKQNQHFLEWFCETAMFNHFIKNMATTYHQNAEESDATDENNSSRLIDTPLPSFYEIFDDRIRSKSKNSGVQTKKNITYLKNKMRDMLVRFQR